MSTSTRVTVRKKRSSLLQARSGKLPVAILDAIARSLKEGSVAIFPTETVYGIGTSVFSREGIRTIYQLKGRTWRKPLALLVPSLEAAGPLVEHIPKEAFRLAKAFCPGPITLVLKASALGRLVTGGTETIAVRIPDHPVALALLKKVGLPLATTSVNKSGRGSRHVGPGRLSALWIAGALVDRWGRLPDSESLFGGRCLSVSFFREA